MAQFYANVQGNRGELTRAGSKVSGITAHVRGWNIGARTEITHENGRDVVRVYITGGSNNPSSKEIVREFIG